MYRGLIFPGANWRLLRRFSAARLKRAFLYAWQTSVV